VNFIPSHGSDNRKIMIEAQRFSVTHINLLLCCLGLRPLNVTIFIAIAIYFFWCRFLRHLRDYMLKKIRAHPRLHFQFPVLHRYQRKVVYKQSHMRYHHGGYCTICPLHHRSRRQILCYLKRLSPRQDQ